MEHIARMRALFTLLRTLGDKIDILGLADHQRRRYIKSRLGSFVAATVQVTVICHLI